MQACAWLQFVLCFVALVSRRKTADQFLPAANCMAEADIRIAMWSGPRNISSAMMRAWGNRDDTFVVDEPFYAFYLKKTGADHPGAEEVIAAGETDWRKIVANLTGPIPNRRPIFYQQQMTQH